MIYFGLFLGAMIWLSAPTLGIVIGSLITMLFALQPFWGGVWTWSHGVTEQLAALGLAITTVGYGHAIVTWVERASSDQSRCSNRFGRNGDCYRMQGELSFSTFAASCNYRSAPSVAGCQISRLRNITAIYSFLIILSCKHSVDIRRIQVDFYLVDSSLSHRIAMLFAAPRFVALAVASVIGAIILAFIASRNSTLDRRRLESVMQVFVVSVTLLCGYLIWEIFFYNGRLPSGMRYDFPFRLLPTLIIGAFASFLVTVFPSKAGWWRAASAFSSGINCDLETN